VEDIVMARNGKNHHLYKIGNVWNFTKMVKGKRIKKPLSSSVTEAREERDRLLKEIDTVGDILRNEAPTEPKLFGEVALKWGKIKATQVRPSTLRAYRGAMNYYLLPKFGNVPIPDIGYLDIEEFKSELKCGPKRVNKVLGPMRSLFRFAHKAGFIEKNPMDLVDNLKVTKSDIYPLSMEEVNFFLEHVSPHYKNFFVVAFFTGMRFGEMAALKWKNVDFKLGVIRVRESRVMGMEGPPKTKRSLRDIKMLPPVIEALRDQRRATMGRSDYVFLNQYGRQLLSDSVNQHVWKPALKKAGLKERSLYQTRHTFATLMLDAGELPGWVQQMMGHETLQMIYDNYYSHIKNYERDDGSAFMKKVYRPVAEPEEKADSGKESAEFTPNLHQTKNGESGLPPNPPTSLKKKVS
jgi:integrase